MVLWESLTTWQLDTTFFALHAQAVQRRLPVLRSQRRAVLRHHVKVWSSSSWATKAIVCPGSRTSICPDWDADRKAHGKVIASALHSKKFNGTSSTLHQLPFTCHPHSDWLSPSGSHERSLGLAVRAADHSAESHKPVNTQTHTQAALVYSKNCNLSKNILLSFF